MVWIIIVVSSAMVIWTKFMVKLILEPFPFEGTLYAVKLKRK